MVSSKLIAMLLINGLVYFNLVEIFEISLHLNLLKFYKSKKNIFNSLLKVVIITEVLNKKKYERKVKHHF